MKEILKRLYDQQFLSRNEAKNILENISDGKYSQVEIASFLTVFKMRSISLDELSGFRECLQERCITVDLEEFDAIDLCGTGGDGKNTFNISTLASFVVAGAGYKVAKHGNYGVSSVCGSSNVLEKIGYKFSNNEDSIKNQLDKCNITFLHAPLYHPAMKQVSPVRKSLGVSTFFNMLGPMVNPSFPKKQLVGVYSLQLHRYYKYLYENEDLSYRIVHSLDGYDELSLTGLSKIASPDSETLLHPNEIIPNTLRPEDLHGGRTVDESVAIFKTIINAEGSHAQNAAVCANAALAIQCYEPILDLKQCYFKAEEALLSKKAQNCLTKLIEL